MLLSSARSLLKVGLFRGSYCQQLFMILAISPGQECGASMRYPETVHQNRQSGTFGTSWGSGSGLSVQMSVSTLLFICCFLFFCFTFLHLLPCLLVAHARIRRHSQGKSLPQQNPKAPHVALCGVATWRHQQGAALAKAQPRVRVKGTARPRRLRLRLQRPGAYATGAYRSSGPREPSISPGSGGHRPPPCTHLPRADGTSQNH